MMQGDGGEMTMAEMVEAAQTDPRQPPAQAAGYAGYAILQLMGNKQVAGYAHEVRQFGVQMIRLILPENDKADAFVRYYSTSAIYSFTPVSEEVARNCANVLQVPQVSVADPFR